jgi:hypothetical protein
MTEAAESDGAFTCTRSHTHGTIDSPESIPAALPKGAAMTEGAESTGVCTYTRSGTRRNSSLT